MNRRILNTPEVAVVFGLGGFLLGFSVVYCIELKWMGKELNRTAVFLTGIMRNLQTWQLKEGL